MKNKIVSWLTFSVLLSSLEPVFGEITLNKDIKFGDFISNILSKGSGKKGEVGFIEGLLPKAAVASVKKYFVGKLFKNLGMTRGTPLSEFIENVIVYISIEDITKIASKNILE